MTSTQRAGPDGQRAEIDDRWFRTASNADRVAAQSLL